MLSVTVISHGGNEKKSGQVKRKKPLSQ